MSAAWLGRAAFGLLIGLILFYLVVPVAIVVPMSFSSARFLTFPPPGLSLRWYQAFFDSPSWMASAQVSLEVAAATVILATPLGTAAAYAIANADAPLMRALHLVLLLPLAVPIIIVAIGMFFVFARLEMVATLTALILANTALGLPYVVTSVVAGLRSFDPAQEMVARSLGMNRFRAFLHVTLPQIRASVLAGAVFAFISALDETVVSLFISGGQNQPLTKRMFTALRDEIDPTIAAISTLMTAASFILVLAVLARAKPGPTEGPNA